MIFKTGESFRDPFHYANSNAAILRFPFPFKDDRYMYSVNLEPHTGGPGAFAAAFDVDEHYLAEIAEKALVLAADASRCRVSADMALAEWDVLALLMEALARDFPAHFTLEKNADAWRWRNFPLGLAQDFVFGEAASLPCPPFEYITRQAQGDFTLHGQRDGTLFLDGGMVTSPAHWSLAAVLGMSFHQWHRPVPLAHGLGVFDKALAFLLRLQTGRAARRTNWSITVNPRLDMSPENSAVWGPDKLGVTPANAGQKLCLRVELQTLHRLARSQAILFGIRTYLIRFEELARVQKWAARLHRVLRDLPPELVAYKGLAPCRQVMLDYLAWYDDGRQLARGRAADQDRL